MLTFLTALLLTFGWLSLAGALGRRGRYATMIVMTVVAMVGVLVSGLLVTDYASWLQGVSLGSMSACLANVVLHRKQRAGAATAASAPVEQEVLIRR